MFSRHETTKPENHRLAFIVLAILAVVPSLVVVIIDGTDSGLLPRIATFTIVTSAFLALIQWDRVKKQGEVHTEVVLTATARKVVVALVVISLAYLAYVVAASLILGGRPRVF